MRFLVILVGGTVLTALGATGQSPARDFSDVGAPIGRTTRFAASEETTRDKPQTDRRDEGQLVNTLHDLFVALDACWMPPPPEKARPGMEYTIRFAFKRNGELMAPARVTYSTHGVPEEVRNAYYEAVEAAFRRCTPIHFSTGMADAIAGRPLSRHIFDDRIMIEQFKNGDQDDDKDGLHALPADGEKPK